MNKRYLIALDLDGTLLNQKGKISFRTTLFLRRLTRKGHLVVLASGRPSHALEGYYRKLKLNTPIICFNGAYILSPCDKNFPTFHHEFPKEKIIEILDKIGSDNLKNVLIEKDDEVWLLKKDAKLLSIFWQDQMKVSYGDFKETLNDNPMTLVIEPKEPNYNEHIAKVVAEYDELGIRFWSFLPFDEIFYKNISKASGLQYILNYYGLTADNLIAIGDGENDIDMIKFAKYGVAMINGTKEIFKHAKLISKKDNNHDGIVFMIKEIMKNLD